MLHAVIRSNQYALHFFAEVSAGTLNTLGQHVRQACRDTAGLRLHIEMEAAEQPAFRQHTRGWLPALVQLGTPVDVEILPRPLA
jgi:hypothetical protein